MTCGARAAGPTRLPPAGADRPSPEPVVEIRRAGPDRRPPAIMGPPCRPLAGAPRQEPPAWAPVPSSPCPSRRGGGGRSPSSASPSSIACSPTGRGAAGSPAAGSSAWPGCCRAWPGCGSCPPPATSVLRRSTGCTWAWPAPSPRPGAGAGSACPPPSRSPRPSASASRSKACRSPRWPSARPTVPSPPLARIGGVLLLTMVVVAVGVALSALVAAALRARRGAVRRACHPPAPCRRGAPRARGGHGPHRVRPRRRPAGHARHRHGPSCRLRAPPGRHSDARRPRRPGGLARERHRRPGLLDEHRTHRGGC